MSNIIDPITWEDKVNNPDLIAFLEQFGKKHYISAEEINEFKDKLNSIITKENSYSYPDEVIIRGAVTKTGNHLFINAGSFKCRVDHVEAINEDAFETTIREAAVGKHRIDILVFNKFGIIEKIEGPESNDSAQEPDLPDGTIKISFTSVFGSVIGDPSIPAIDGYFVKRMESQDLIISLGATTIVERISVIDERSSIVLTGAITDVKSIQMSGQFMRLGKPFFIKNRTGHDVKLWHLAGTGNVKIFFQNAADLIIKNNEVVAFNMNANDTSVVQIEFVGLGLFKEELSNKKTTIVGNEASDLFYGTIKAWITYLKENWLSSLATKVAITDTTMFPVEDEGDSNKAKVVSFLNIKNTIKAFLDAIFQAKDNQVEISANSNVLNAWHGQTILFTASCTITVPASLSSSLMFPWRTLPGVNVTWAITSPHVWETTPVATPEKTVGHFMKRGATNTIMLDV